MRRPEIETAADRIAAIVDAVDDTALDRSTPCADYTVAALLDHIDGFVGAFTAAGTKTQTGNEGPPGAGDASHLREDWRTALPAGLRALVAAWRSDEAYAGTVSAGGFSMPADSVAVVAIEELVIHGWDLARALDVPYAVTSAELAVIDEFFGQFGPEQRGAAYGPALASAGSAPHLDRVLAESGRDAAWSAAVRTT
jgi:uncharacterized protein (TIGR03086 family)